jgi:hypothetical protein
MSRRNQFSNKKNNKSPHKILKNKKAIELSINFVVMLIMAVAVFIGGLVFTAKFFKQAEGVRGALSSQTEAQLEKLLDSGSPTVIPINTKEIFRNKYDSFALGIMARAEGKYIVRVTPGQAFNREKVLITNNKIKIDPTETSLDLKKNQKGKMVILVDVPSDTEKGTYIFKVTVELRATDPSQNMVEYDAPLQMIVKVP